MSWRHIVKAASDTIAAGLSEPGGDVVYTPHGASPITNLRGILRNPSVIADDLDGEFADVRDNEILLGVRIVDLTFTPKSGLRGQDRDTVTVSGETAIALGVTDGTVFEVAETRWDGEAFVDFVLHEIPT